MDLFDGKFRVDDFRQGADLYALTHYHSDHMRGLRKGWSRAPLLCTPQTAELLKIGKRVDPDVLRPVGLGDPVSVSQGDLEFTLTAFDANHCPGAAMFLIETGVERILVTGDFRLDDGMREILPHFSGIDHLLVDVTYDDPGYEFPTQEKVIADMVSFIGRMRDQGRKDLVVIETYTIGKNKVLQGIFDAFGEPFYLDETRFPLYCAIGYEGIVTDDPEETHFFACGRRHMDGEPKRAWPDWRRRAAVIFPTGWAVKGRGRRGALGFPYSEHCSYSELLEFLKAVNPGTISMTEGGKVIGTDWTPPRRD